MEQPRPRCDGCGGNMEPWQWKVVIYDCFHALHAACATGSGACPRCRTPRTPSSSPPQPPPGSPGWPGSSAWSTPGSPELSPLPPSHDDQFGQSASPYDRVPFGHPPPPLPANTFRPPPPPPHPQAGQFGCPPASSQPPSQGGFFRPPPLPFESLYFSNFPPVVPPAPAPPAHHFGRSLIPPAPQPIMASSFNPVFRPMHQPFPQPPSHYPAFQTSASEYQPQQPAPACFAYAPPAAAGPPSCAACGGAVVRRQTAVTSQCDHTFHFLCFTVSARACPACGAQWRDVGTVSLLSPEFNY